MEEAYRKRLRNVKNVLIKVGTSTLTYPSGKLNLNYIERIVRELADLKNQGKEVLLVSSGAIGAGLGKLGFKRRPKTTPEKQAIAAVGQGMLIQVYEKIFSEYGHTVAQLLLTRDDLVNRQRYINARNTLITLLKYGVVPIINENDTVSVDEIEFGDNDNLSALVASLIDVDLLINLSDIDGLYTSNPHTDSEAKLVTYVPEITAEIENLAQSTCGSLGTGGMKAKLQAANIAVCSGVPMVIANGQKPGIIHDIICGERIGTLFLPKEKPMHSRKRWIAFGLTVQGTLTVDSGAKIAVVRDGKSLLPSGINYVEGNFERGETVCIADEDGIVFARGLVNYPSSDLIKIMGLKSSEISKVLRENGVSEVIHRDNLVII
ncbi:glutamate 5-kinase [Candidatus Contubernalis alkaliaceticus]|uniref:glutamate 5-kinase n=1 Tax=Candidatus Contubernalis alkaliaceticus TaxID=338645 RepID=UPI001F4BF6B9|nr:glutamate 5-kinase [Candidatus Contubernalis alkalaceticus]UNC92396.1 glutamate 5-kinase [Candidatus Contubernalis alkalaceticus]